MVVQAKHADDRMMDFYFFRKEKEGMMSESCRSLCAIALDLHKHTQVWLREDMSGCMCMCASPLDMF